MSSGSISEPPCGESPDNDASTAITEALGALWTKRRPEVVADLESLLALLGDLKDSDLERGDLANHAGPTDGITEARAMAHRLHGTFGVFGWTSLKDELGAIEQALISGNVAFSDHISAVRGVLAELP